MTLNTELHTSYPKEWEEIEREEIPKKKIDEYFLRFIARLLKEVKKGEREDIDLGDAAGMGLVHAQNKGYKFNHFLYDFLVELGDYQIVLPGGFVGGGVDTPEEVETELKKVAKKLKISLK